MRASGLAGAVAEMLTRFVATPTGTAAIHSHIHYVSNNSQQQQLVVDGWLLTLSGFVFIVCTAYRDARISSQRCARRGAGAAVPLHVNPISGCARVVRFRYAKAANTHQNRIHMATRRVRRSRTAPPHAHHTTRDSHTPPKGREKKSTARGFNPWTTTTHA